MKRLLLFLPLAALAMPPAPPPFLLVQQFKNVTLAWDYSDSTNVVHYHVYQGIASGTYTQRITVGITNRATLSVPILGVTNYFVATASDVEQESSNSNEVAWSYPFPPGMTQHVVTVSLDYRLGPTLEGPWTRTNTILTVVTNPPGNLFYRADRLVVTNLWR